MIGFLQGEVIFREDNQITLLVKGVGYEVFCTLNAQAKSSSAQIVSLWTHQVVREDVLQLYGFASTEERVLFRELIRISGVGPKVALGVLSGMDTAGLLEAIRNSDVKALTKLPGIGKKTAERLVIEMRDRLEQLPNVSGASQEEKAIASNVLEAEAALVSLGYKPTDAEKAIASVTDAESMSLEDIIRHALKSRLQR